jgi:putative FmdB family regulatory protein
MPLYLYRCTRCGREVEELQRVGDPPPEPPEACEAAPRVGDRIVDPAPACVLERVLTSATPRFKPEPSSDGRGGWRSEQNGQTMQRTHRRKLPTYFTGPKSR